MERMSQTNSNDSRHFEGQHDRSVDPHSARQVIGEDGDMRRVFERVAMVARSNAPVTLLGETGTGKEVVARSIHERSSRHDKPFLRVNCGAIAPELIDSELFGHEEGSFTGAKGRRRGWFERADTGTLLLDECGELTPPAQVRLLRVLQEGTFERVGGEQTISVDVRIIAATHRDLDAMVKQGTFRSDLWYRLAVFPIDLPPLRERPNDLVEMTRVFAFESARKFGLKSCVPSSADLALVLDYRWPGNVRELKAVIDRAVLLGEGNYLDLATSLGRSTSSNKSLPSSSSNQESPTSSAARFDTLDEAMRRHIEKVLFATRGQIEGERGAAKILGINPHTLRGRMRKLDVDCASLPRDH